jgi:hypothetical protein
MIEIKVLKVKKDVEVTKGVLLQEGQEIEIVMDVVYIGGNMVPPPMQPIFYSFVTNNPQLFEDDTRIW